MGRRRVTPGRNGARHRAQEPAHAPRANGCQLRRHVHCTRLRGSGGFLKLRSAWRRRDGVSGVHHLCRHQLASSPCQNHPHGAPRHDRGEEEEDPRALLARVCHQCRARAREHATPIANVDVALLCFLLYWQSLLLLLSPPNKCSVPFLRSPTRPTSHTTGSSA